jgi:hypothetical protein
MALEPVVLDITKASGASLRLVDWTIVMENTIRPKSG